MTEFPNAEPRKKLVISFDDEELAAPPPPAQPPRQPAPPAPPADGALWSGHTQAPAPPPRMPAPAPAPFAPPPPRGNTHVRPLPPPDWPPPPAPVAGWQQRPAAPGTLASWGSRLLASLIDGAISLAIAVAVMLLVGASILGAGDGTDEAGVAGVFFGILALTAVSFVWSLFYAPVTMMRSGVHNGQTLGKQLVGIRVTRLDGLPVGMGTAFGRDVVMKNIVIWGFGSFLLYVPPILSSLWPLWDPQRQAWWDKAVSTVVTDA